MLSQTKLKEQPAVSPDCLVVNTGTGQMVSEKSTAANDNHCSYSGARWRRRTRRNNRVSSYMAGGWSARLW